ncbi:hypothetical protein WJX79_004977 [Trebouxia sp. C0005]
MVTDFRPRNKRWIRLRIGTYAFFGNMHQRKLRPQPPRCCNMVLLNALVNDTRQLRGHAILPVTVRLLRQRSEAYLPFLNRVLTDLIPAAANNQQGTKLFTLLPQCSNQMAFVEITTSGLHRLLHLMPDSPPFIPDLNSRTTPLFEVRKVLWWMMFTSPPQQTKWLSQSPLDQRIVLGMQAQNAGSASSHCLSLRLKQSCPFVGTSMLQTTSLANGTASTPRVLQIRGMSANLRLEGKVKLKKMLLPGKAFSSCVSAPNGAGELILAPPMMADVMALHVSPGNEWIVGESCFLAFTPGVQKSIKAQGLGKALFSGEGLFVTKVSGTGVAFITSLGAIHGIDLAAGQDYIIENDHLVAWHASMTYKIENVGSFMTSLVSSEGKICRFSGPGTVYMQTRNPSALADYMRSIGVGRSQ